MANRMRLYCVVIVQQDKEVVTTTRIKSYGRSKYEAIGYVMLHNIFSSYGIIISCEAVSCWDDPKKGNNSKTLRDSY